jgi:hypothetical protein
MASIGRSRAYHRTQGIEYPSGGWKSVGGSWRELQVPPFRSHSMPGQAGQAGPAYFLSLPDQRVYTRSMSAHIIGNPVPTPEEMGEILGLSSERVAAVRRIMSTTGAETGSKRSISARKTATRKKKAAARKSVRSASKK